MHDGLRKPVEFDESFSSIQVSKKSKQDQVRKHSPLNKLMAHMQSNVEHIHVLSSAEQMQKYYALNFALTYKTLNVCKIEITFL